MSLHGYRKFLFAVMVVLVSALLLAYRKLESGNFTTIVVAVAGGFLVTNAAQGVLTKAVENKTVQVKVTPKHD
jgi:hypothetical protein